MAHYDDMEYCGKCDSYHSDWYTEKEQQERCERTQARRHEEKTQALPLENKFKELYLKTYPEKQSFNEFSILPRDYWGRKELYEFIMKLTETKP